MDDREVREQVKATLESRSTRVPDFDATWLAAEARYLAERRRFRRISGIAAAVAIVAVVVSLLPDEHSALQGALEIGDDFYSSTLWTAPSDVLIPQHDIDVYQDLPVLMESTEYGEESLL